MAVPQIDTAIFHNCHYANLTNILPVSDYIYLTDILPIYNYSYLT